MKKRPRSQVDRLLEEAARFQQPSKRHKGLIPNPPPPPAKEEEEEEEEVEMKTVQGMDELRSELKKILDIQKEHEKILCELARQPSLNAMILMNTELCLSTSKSLIESLGKHQDHFSSLSTRLKEVQDEIFTMENNLAIVKMKVNEMYHRHQMKDILKADDAFQESLKMG
jgi:hypothetical protein